MMRPRPVALFIHGGAGADVPSKRRALIRRRLRAIAARAYECLGDSALEAVRVAVGLLEDDPMFNAGTGSVLQRDGQVRMSASLMDGARRRFAGVLNIERVRHPIAVAAALLERSDRILAGPQALRFARSQGHAAWNPVTAERLRQWQRQSAGASGTVGAVAVDAQGRLAAATSTGGKPWAVAGRVSDSGLPAGNYADHLVAISCTGFGEDIVDEGLAVRLAQRVADRSSLMRAMARCFKELRDGQRRLAAIGVDRQGHLSWATTLPVLFAVGCARRRRVETF